MIYEWKLFYRRNPDRCWEPLDGTFAGSTGEDAIISRLAAFQTSSGFHGAQYKAVPQDVPATVIVSVERSFVLTAIED